MENIEAFIEGAATFARTNGPTTLVDYLESISLYTDLDAYQATEDKVTLLTLHAAKGLEYDSVFIVGLEDGLFPLQRAMDDPMELEEERRLFYVGATRARKRLYLSTASSRFRFGEVMSIPSRFIKEIPEELIDAVNLKTLPTRTHRPTPARSLFGDSTTDAAVPEGVHYEWDNDHAGLRPGRIVQHPTFGRGKIVGADGFGESLRLEIMFTGIGIKKIMAKYARLKVVG
ncbi:MAG: ATP-binding domain-containing protein [candidate division Zixibacteria bacterium]|nr:ATP-binding domain-containing protein [candidate division Zixibacteria bacterium]